MRVAIGGSSGMLATALARRLIRRGDEVVRLVRHPPTGSQERSWDPESGRISAPGLDDVDAVVNLAGAPIAGGRWTRDRKAELRRSRLAPTLTIVAALSPQGRCRRILNASAIGFYGDRGIEVVDETSPQGTGFLAELVGQWEAATRNAPVPTTLLRTGQVLSPTGGLLASQRPIFLAGFGGRIGTGRQFLSWISLNDHLRAMLWLLDHELSGPVNLTAPEPVPNAAFTRAYAAFLRRPAVVPLPLTAVRLAFGGEFVTEALLSSTRARPARLTDAGFHFEQPQLAAALAALKDG